MTKEDWTKVRVEPHIPLGVWFEYYRENGGDIDDPIEFERAFNQVMARRVICQSGGRMMFISYETARNRLFSYYDSMFGI